MIYVKQQDKRLCVQAGCTATSFLGLAAAQNQKATAQPLSMVRSFRSKIKIESLITESCPGSPRPVFAILGRFAPQPRTGVEVMNPGAGRG